MRKILTLLLTLLLPIAPLIALASETAYITDKFMIKVFSLQNESGLLVASLPSGTAVEILATDGTYAHIKTPDGKTGWLNTKFLKKEKPGAQAYSELLTKYNSLNTQLEKAKVDLHKLNEVERVARNAGAARDELNNRKKQIDQLEHDLKTRDRQLALAQQNISELKQELENNQPDADNNSSSQPTNNSNDASKESASDAPPMDGINSKFMVPFPWALIAMVFMTIIGFILGMKWLERRIRKRHGGVQLY